MNIAAGHARVQNVAHNGYAQIVKTAFVVADGVHVQQPLCGMSVASVASIDHVHMRRHVLCN